MPFWYHLKIVSLQHHINVAFSSHRGLWVFCKINFDDNFRGFLLIFSISIPTLYLLIIIAVNFFEWEIEIELLLSISGAPYLLYEIDMLGAISFSSNLMDRNSIFLFLVLNFKLSRLLDNLTRSFNDSLISQIQIWKFFSLILWIIGIF